MSVDLAKLELGAVVAERTSDAIRREDLVRYAEASGDLNPLHLDAAFARKAGFDDVIVHGMLTMALLGRLLTDHFPAERVVAFSARFGAPLAVGGAVTCRARLASRSDRGATLALEATGPDGKPVLSGTAELRDAAGVRT